MSRARRLALVAGAALLLLPAATIAAATSNAAPAGPAAYYPDLQTVVPSHLQLVNKQQRDVLRFTNGFVNLGGGPLALRPDFSDPQSTTATQEIRDHSGAVVQELYAGSYEFHPTHNHWHVANAALFEVHRGGPAGPVVGTSSIKVGHCLIDWYRLDGNSPTSQRTFHDCERGYQGASVGWVDQYHHQLDGQSVDLTDVADGEYWFVSTANPSAAFAEANYANNSAWVRFRLTGRGTGNRKLAIVDTSLCTGGMCGSTTNR